MSARWRRLRAWRSSCVASAAEKMFPLDANAELARRRWSRRGTSSVAPLFGRRRSAVTEPTTRLPAAPFLAAAGPRVEGLSPAPNDDEIAPAGGATDGSSDIHVPSRQVRSRRLFPGRKADEPSARPQVRGRMHCSLAVFRTPATLTSPHAFLTAYDGWHFSTPRSRTLQCEHDA